MTAGSSVRNASTNRAANISGSSSHWAIFRYVSGDNLADGLVVPGPRGFFFSGETASTQLNATGLRYLEETILATDTF